MKPRASRRGGGAWRLDRRHAEREAARVLLLLRRRLRVSRGLDLKRCRECWRREGASGELRRRLFGGGSAAA